ncbi:hypothetical protein NMD15_16520 (plasmid) [Plesiomonas shigelloides]|uniref:hypothetical protein n=1 Tax=Plesiomonas shigelloides TaxID=703 RepID=UPI00351DA4E3
MMILRYQLTKLSLAFQPAKKVTHQLNECDKSPSVSRCVIFLMGGFEQKITPKVQKAPKAGQPTFGT